MSAPKYPQTLHTATGSLGTANTARDGTGTIATIITGVANGTVLQRIRITAGGSTTDGMIRIFRYDGTNYRLIAELNVPLRTPSVTIPVWSTVWVPPGGELPLQGTSDSIRMSTNNAETFYVVAESMDY